MTIPLVDLAAQSAEIVDEVLPVLERVLRTASFVGGEPVREFEAGFAAYTGVSHCVGVGNGTDALELALRAAGVTAGDEVILPANTFIATAEAVSRIGASPVLVDVDPDRLLIDPLLVDKAITARTRAVVPVHLFGQVAPMEPLADLTGAAGIALVEDAAQAQGARRAGRTAGTFGVAAATSFYPGKNLGAAGDAGAVLTDDEELATRVRVLADHGSPRKYVHDVVGFNSRLDAVQAVVLTAKLRRLEGWNRARRAAALRYAELLAELPGVRLPVPDGPQDESAWHLFVVRVPDRDRVLARLHEAGVGAGVHYPTPIHLTGAYAHLGHGPGDFPVAEEAAGQILSLPLHAHLGEADQEMVVEVLGGSLQ